MAKKRKPALRLSALVLCLGLLLTFPSSAADLYFTSVNDTLCPLTADTMPAWFGGALYVPYTVFDSSTTNASLGVDVSYGRLSNTVTLYTLRQMLVFDLNEGTCRDSITGESYNARAIVRNNQPYLPLGTVCSFFGLEYSYTAFSQGYLVRIKSSAVVLSDAKFIDAAGNLINRRLQEYNQSLNPTVDSNAAIPPVTPSTPSTPSNNTGSPSPADVTTYLAFLCRDGEGTAKILDALDSGSVHALFLFTPQALEEECGLVRRALGSGHSVGILAEGGDLAQTQALLAQGSRLLEQTAHTRTTLAYVPKDQRSALEQEGWVCWSETLVLSPTQTVGAGTFAANTLRRLEGRTASAYLTMEGNDSAGRVLPTLLYQLKNKHFVVSTPMETRI